MSKSSDDYTRWVVVGVHNDAVRVAKILAVTHNVSLGQVVTEAILQLENDIFGSTWVPDGWEKGRDA